MFRLEDVIVRS